MWGNLARGLKENLDVGSIRETISHVADVVAPPLSDDEYETDEEEYEYYEEEIVEEESQKNKKSLGSMLQHMLDDEEEIHHRQELKEQEERYMRPMIPDDGDDIQEEIVDFDSDSNEKPVDPESDNTLVPPPPPMEMKKSISPTGPGPHHVPGVPVPHTYKENELMESASVNKGKVFATEPVRATWKSAETVNSTDYEYASSFRPIGEPPKPSPYETRNEPIKARMKEVICEAKIGKEASSISETFIDTHRKDGSVMNGRKSKSPVPPLPKPSTAAAGPQQVSQSQPPILTPSVADDKEPAVTTANVLKEPDVTAKAKVRAGPPPPPPVPFQEKVSKDAEDAVKKPQVVKAKVPSASRDEHAEAATTVEKSSPSPPSPIVQKHAFPSAPDVFRDEPLHAQSVAATAMEEEKTPVATSPKKQSTQELLKKANQVVNSKKKDADSTEMIKMQRRCQDLEKQLRHAELHIVELQRDAAKRMDEEEEWRQSHLSQFQQEQARIVEAATEAASQEHEREMQEMRDLLQQECFLLKNQLEEEKLKSERQAEQFQRVLKEAEARVEAAEKEKRRIESKQQSSMSQIQQQQEHAVRMAEDKLAHTLAKLDDREEEVAKLKVAIKELKASTTEHREVAQEAEEEMDELHAENESLQHKLMAVTAERDELNKQLLLFNSQKEKMSGLQMELRMLKEARDRERAHRENAAVDAESNQAELLAERDVAMATVRDLERQLKAALADLDIAKADADRITMANVNFQSALEAFQSERDAEMQMVQEQREEAELATAASHAAAIEATREANEARMREVQMAADAAVKNVMREVQELEAKLEESRKESSNLRHSLDEAIRRLQTSQEDVIDRILMKNILLDWFSKTGKNKRDVLALMASVLHFTEEEKDAIHIGDHPGGAFGKVVGAVAPPFPPSATDIEHLEGDTVREKWVNFLLAEAGDYSASHHANSENDEKANGEAR